MTREINEINARWQRDHRQLRKMALYLGAWAPPLWLGSYEATFRAVEVSITGNWFTAFTIFTFVAAMGVSIGAATTCGFLLMDDPPFDGSNHYLGGRG